MSRAQKANTFLTKANWCQFQMEGVMTEADTVTWYFHTYVYSTWGNVDCVCVVGTSFSTLDNNAPTYKNYSPV